MGAFELFRGDALDACRTWPAPATIISDGAGYWYEIMDRCGSVATVCCGLIVGWSLA